MAKSEPVYDHTWLREIFLNRGINQPQTFKEAVTYARSILKGVVEFVGVCREGHGYPHGNKWKAKFHYDDRVFQSDWCSEEHYAVALALRGFKLYVRRKAHQQERPGNPVPTQTGAHLHRFGDCVAFHTESTETDVTCPTVYMSLEIAEPFFAELRAVIDDIKSNPDFTKSQYPARKV